MVPVTQVPMGKVKLYQVSANGSPRRAVRTVLAAARTSHTITVPQTGIPYSGPRTAGGGGLRRGQRRGGLGTQVPGRGDALAERGRTPGPAPITVGKIPSRSPSLPR